MTIKKLLNIIIPRFITEDTAVCCVGCSGMYEPICSMDDIEPWEELDGIITMQFFNFFGFALFARQIGDVRPWVNPHYKVKS